MRVIGIRELRQNASRYLAQVEAGEELEVTNRGRVVARLVPVTESVRTREALIDAGVIVAAQNPTGLGAIDTSRLPAGSLTSLLDEDRQDR
ncbi:type II toxin-antitoxin system prevent-host-death family antitoxin [Williamsia sp.]|uniref:type II toxin-antitoxin system Phd/YefM family antitoxin n=1 Tax=Williamsia sp. TaxID=1872085 RepID=UPI001A19059D|nr:type II toxin-antitoxin system prevent-host-death family antitoxin [Williamsia sp.]MBJ7289470.1 type II toxin-antitoxin system prevent-host-death family antitoxin [Williamsia sp.]